MNDFVDINVILKDSNRNLWIGLSKGIALLTKQSRKNFEFSYHLHTSEYLEPSGKMQLQFTIKMDKITLMMELFIQYMRIWMEYYLLF